MALIEREDASNPMYASGLKFWGVFAEGIYEQTNLTDRLNVGWGESAMEYVLGSTFVCKNIDATKEINLSISLDGGIPQGACILGQLLGIFLVNLQLSAFWIVHFILKELIRRSMAETHFDNAKLNIPANARYFEENALGKGKAFNNTRVKRSIKVPTISNKLAAMMIIYGGNMAKSQSRVLPT
uniref:Uncharacterized protein n=1 Tax=Cucumis melo TaxID=3656 RepID=A0A9I9EH15_CUCME